MRTIGKKVLVTVQILILVLTMCIPAYGAAEQQAGELQENQTSAEEKVSGENDIAESSSLICNYIMTQDDGEHQSVILDMGTEESTVLESAVLSYRDGEGETMQIQAEEVQENLAAFLLDMPQEGMTRVFLSVETSVQGRQFVTNLEKPEEMDNVEISEEEASAAIGEGQSNNELDTATVEQVEKCVITADENGITAEDIGNAVEEINNLAVESAAAVSAYSLQSNDTQLPAQPRDKSNYIVVLDPGHGGSDGGAENQYGTEPESKLALKIAKYLKEELSKYSQLTVYMTREDDTYVGLSERVQFAVNKKADILVSLHLNSFDYNTANGAEVLVPRSGRYNSAVAENAESLAKNILKRITSLGLYDRGLKYRDSENGSKYPDGSTADYFATIAGGLRYGIPSIIVEHAFISGAKDAQYLDSEEDLKNFAKADAYGIAQYFDIETGGENFEEVPKNKGEWRKVSGKWYYYIGNEKQTGWVKVDNIWYYLNGSGIMQTGWQKVGGSWYYMNASGRMLTGWQKVSGKWYYLNDSGSMRTGWQEISGKKYYLNGSGAMQTGWQKLDGKWYYFNGSGAMLAGWQKVSGKWYYLDESGIMLTGWQKVSGKWYYLNGSGVMQNGGWTKLSGEWYYLNGNGAAQTGWGKIKNVWYYFNDKGVMLTGWQKVNSKWYYMNGSGAMYAGGWLKLSGKWYYLNNDGAMQTGWKKVKNVWYYMADSGAMCTGWQKVSGKWYYMNGSGAMQSGGWLKLNGKWYYLNAGGDMAENWKYIKNYWYYFKPESGAMQTGWFEVSGSRYYSDGNGHMKTGWQKLKNKWYYMNSSGVMQTGWITVNNKEYYLDESGVWIEDAKRVEDNSSTQTLYGIMGTTTVTKEQMVKYFEKTRAEYPTEALAKGGAADIETFCAILKEEADAEGLCAEVVFAQVMKETGWLKFGGDVQVEQFNFAGLGATGNGEKGNSFADVRTGLRAQVQHLKAYASDAALVYECVDERFKYVERNCAPYVEWLGIGENPQGKGWATAPNYGYDLLNMITEIKAL